MKKHIITTTGCLIVAISLLGCAHTKPVTATAPVVISISADGTLAIDGQQCPWVQLADTLKTKQNRKSAGVSIHVAKATRYSDVVAATDACKAAGFLKVSLQNP